MCIYTYIHNTIIYYIYTGTEDVVRIYAEASTGPEVEKLLINAVDIIKKYLPYKDHMCIYTSILRLVYIYTKLVN